MTVALICDVHNWALDGIARALKTYCSSSLSLDIIYQKDIWARGASAAQVKQLLDKYDLLYPLSCYQAAWVRRLGYRDYITTIHASPMKPSGAATIGYSPELYEGVLPAKRVSTISSGLWRTWIGVRPDLQRVTVGADPAIFYPGPDTPRLGPLRVGWVGDPSKECKRFDLIAPACRGGECEFVPLAVSNMEQAQPQATVGEYMRTLDVYVCMSDHEGLPTPGVEAAVSGVPIISTDVGVMREVVADGLTGFIIPQSSAVLQARLQWMVAHRDRLPGMRREIARRAEVWHWPYVVHGWEAFIKEAL